MIDTTDMVSQKEGIGKRAKNMCEVFREVQHTGATFPHKTGMALYIRAARLRAFSGLRPASRRSQRL